MLYDPVFSPILAGKPVRKLLQELFALAAPLKQGDTMLEVIWFFLLQGSWPAAKEPWFMLVSQGPEGVSRV